MPPLPSYLAGQAVTTDAWTNTFLTEGRDFLAQNHTRQWQRVAIRP
jgi:hypothetical protein